MGWTRDLASGRLSTPLGLDAFRIDESTFWLLPCVWSSCRTVEWCSPWIWWSISPLQVSLHLLESTLDALSSMLVVSWRPSCKGFSTIFRCERGDSQTLLYNYSPEFMTTTFSIHTAGKVRWRMIALDLVWKNVNPFFWATLKLAQYTVFWCILQFCLYRKIVGFVTS